MNINQIYKFYDEIKDWKNKCKAYYDMKKEIQNLGKEIFFLKTEKSKIKLQAIRDKILELEKEKEEIDREIQMNKIQNFDCTNIEDLKQIFINLNQNENINEECENICFQKATSFYKGLIQSFLAKNIISKFTNQIETDLITVLRIDKETEEFFSLVKNFSFSKEILHEFKENINFELNDSIFTEISIFSDNSYIFILIPQYSKDVDLLGIEPFEIPKDYEFSIFNNFNSTQYDLNEKIPYGGNNIKNTPLLATEFPNISEQLFFVLKRNLCKRTVIDELEIEDIIANNRIFLSSGFVISNAIEFQLDNIMKTILKESKMRIEPVEDDDQEEGTSCSEKMNDGIFKYECEESGVIRNPNIGRYYSKRYSLIRKSLKLFTKSKSNRKEKALKVIEKSLLKYFSTEYEEPEEYFILYSDISHFTQEFILQNISTLNNSIPTNNKSPVKFKEISEFENKRKNILKKTIELSNIFTIDISKDLIVNLAILRSIEHDFDLNVQYFISKKESKFFYLKFLSRFYNTFVQSVLTNLRFDSQDISNVIKICKWLMDDLPIRCDKTQIKSFKRLQSIYKIFKCEHISQVSDLFNDNLLFLENYELKVLIKLIFEESSDKEALLNKIF